MLNILVEKYRIDSENLENIENLAELEEQDKIIMDDNGLQITLYPKEHRDE